MYNVHTYNHSRLSLSTANLAVGLPALLQKTLIKLKITNKYGGITFKNYIFTKVINFPLKTIQINISSRNEFLLSFVSSLSLIAQKPTTQRIIAKMIFLQIQRNSFSTHSVEREIFESKVKKPIYKLGLAIGLTKTLGFSSLFQDGGATKSE